MKNCSESGWPPRTDPQPGQAVWRTGVLDKVLDVVKKSATRAARRAPHDTSCEDIIENCTEARNELHGRRGCSQFQLLIGRSPPGLPPEDEKCLGEISASLTADGRRRLHMQRVCCKSWLDEELGLQQGRRHIQCSRPWCVWRSRAHSHRRTKGSRQFKVGTLMGPVRVLLLQREGTREGCKHRATLGLWTGIS